MQCVICQQPRKYKCPKCLIPYCSAPCFKQHCCNPQPKPQEQVDDVIKSEYIDEEVKLPKKQLDIIKSSQKIRKYLSNTRLQKKLLSIDNAKSRFNELNRSMKHDKDFEQFCVLMLSEMGFIDENGIFISS